MKKLLAILLSLSLLWCSLSVLADEGCADVVMEGETYSLTLKSVDITDGQLTVVIEGFGDTLRMGPKGWMVAGWPVAHFGDEAVRAAKFNAHVGGPFTFFFDRDTLPDEIWMDPYDEDGPETLIWSRDGKGAAADSAGASIPEALVGGWTGVGKPKNGGTSIDLALEINADGSGVYTFDQGSYHEHYPFTISNDDSTFSVDIPATSMLGSVTGTWALENGKLLLIRDRR